MSLAPIAQAQHELSISRLIDAPPAKVFRAWTEPQWLMQWWGPRGMTTPECEMQLWAGGLFRTLMRAPDGSEYPNQGVFLEIAAPRRLVFTDAFGPGWVPSDKAFMTAVISFDEEQGKTPTPPVPGTGMPPTAVPMKKWASTKAGEKAWTAWWRW